MLNERMEKALCAQINAELYSSYLYVSMSAWFSSLDLPGFANWMRVQAQEELFHATKFYDFVLSRQGRVILTSLDGPPTKWASPLAAFRDAQAHEAKVTGLINNLTDLAIAEKDHATRVLLDWFVNEQVEEEANAAAIASQLMRMGEDSSSLFMLDRELGQRVFTPPAAPAP
jgi:ferritin